MNYNDHFFLHFSSLDNIWEVYVQQRRIDAIVKLITGCNFWETCSFKGSEMLTNVVII